MRSSSPQESTADRSRLLDVTQESEVQGHAEEETGETRNSSSEGSYCDCHFCIQQNNSIIATDPIGRFRLQTGHEAPQLQNPNYRLDEPRVDPDYMLDEDTPVSTQVTRFRDTHNTLNSDDSSNSSSMLSFNYQDDIIASSPVFSRDVNNSSRDVINSSRDVMTPSNASLLDVGSLFLLPSETPQELGRSDHELTDSMVVLGSNSHVRRLSDSDSDDED